MKKRYLTAAAILALGVCIVLAVLALLPPRPGLTKANFNRIEIGMTEAEVDAIFLPRSATATRYEMDQPQKGERTLVWADAEGAAIVSFGRNGSVMHTRWSHFELTLLQRIQFYLGVL